MKKRFILFFVAIGLIMAFTPTTSTIDLRFIPVSPSISDSVWLLGHKKTTGVYTTYRFSMPQLASYLGAGTGLGNNFANADLDVDASRFHSFHKYGMVWDGVYYFNYVDTLGDTILSVNNFSNPHNCMIRIGSFGNTGSIVMNTKDNGHGHLGVASSAVTMGSGSAFGQFSATTGICFLRFGVSTYSNIYVDSPTHTVYIGDWATNKGLQIDYTSGTTKVNNAFFLPSVDALSTDQFITSNGAGVASWATITKLGLVTKYNGSTVVGNGIPAIRASSFSAGATTAQTIASITASANVYEVGGFVNINSISVDELALRLTFTDVSNVVHTQDLTPNGAPNNRLTAAVHYIFPKVEIMPKFGSTISISTVLTTGGGSINYDFSGHIVQMN